MKSATQAAGFKNNRLYGRAAATTDGAASLLRKLTLPALVFLITTIPFLPALRNGFVNWDDGENLLANSYYRGLGWTQVKWMFTTFHNSLYRPLTWVSLGADYLLWGMAPFGYHLTSILLHCVNAVLVYFLAVRLFALATLTADAPGKTPLRIAAGFTALFFAIHPLRVEAVVWASARNDVLSGIFFIWCILCYLKATSVSDSEPSRRRWLRAAIMIYALALLSKGSVITLPLVLSVLDVYPLRRLGGGAEKWFWPRAGRIWWEKVPFWLLAAAAAALALAGKQQSKLLFSLDQYGLVERLAQSFYGLAFYLWKTLLPVGLSPLYEVPPHIDFTEWPFLLSVIVVVAVTLALVFFRREWPWGLATWLCYMLILLPVLGVAQNGPQLAADRYSYLSCLGWAFMIGAGLLHCWRARDSTKIRRPVITFSGGMTGLLLVVFAVLSWRQTQVWQNSEQLWRHALAIDERSFLAHHLLGTALLEERQPKGAIEEFRQALQINPNYASAYDGLGNALAENGKLEEAVESYRQAIRIDPAFAVAHYNLGRALAKQGEWEEAITHYRQAVKINPLDADAHNNLGLALAKRGDLGLAVEQFNEALRIDPAYAKAYFNLARISARQGQLDDAVRYFQQALRVQPEVAEIHESLARVLAMQGKKEEALEHYQKALSILRTQK